jgi:transposase-like protein
MLCERMHSGMSQLHCTVNGIHVSGKRRRCGLNQSKCPVKRRNRPLMLAFHQKNHSATGTIYEITRSNQVI